MAAEGFSLPRGFAGRPLESGGADLVAVDTRGQQGHYGALAAPSGTSLDSYRITPHRCFRVQIVDLGTGEVVRLPCKSWRCEVCSVTNRRAFSKRLRMGLSDAAASDGERPKLLTLTSQPLEPAWESRRLLGRRFAEVRRRLLRAFPGATINYAGAVEVTERGAVHFHVVLRGVPYMPQGVWSRLVAAVGFGYVVDVRAVRSGDGMAGYLTKQLGGYLTKQAASRAWPMHFRRIRFSQAWAEGWTPRGRRPRQPEGQSPWVLLRITAGNDWQGLPGAEGGMAAGQGPP